MSSHETAQFDGLARHYHWMEAVLAGDKLERCRNAHLEHIENPQDILLVGEGHGKFLVETARRWPDSAITYLDASEKMLAVARACLEREERKDARVTFLCGDLLTVPLGRYDLIGTHFLLDCLTPEQLDAAVRKLAIHLKGGGQWVLSDFQVPENGWRRRRAQAIHWLMYQFFRVVTRLPAEKITPPAPLLERNGLVCERREEFDWGLLHAELWRKPY